MPQISRSADLFDAVVVGSGATGGWAAKELSEAGMKVALLEAGPKVTQKDFTEHVQSWQLPYLGMSPKLRETHPIQGQCYGQRTFSSPIPNTPFAGTCTYLSTACASGTPTCTGGNIFTSYSTCPNFIKATFLTCTRFFSTSCFRIGVGQEWPGPGPCN